MGDQKVADFTRHQLITHTDIYLLRRIRGKILLWSEKLKVVFLRKFF